MSWAEEMFVFFLFFFACCLGLFLSIGIAGATVWTLKTLFG